VSNTSIGKLVAGGVLASVVMNICDYISNNFILANDWEHISRIRNVDVSQMTSGTALATYVLVDIVLGFLVVWTYAAIRPRLGRGPGTAIVAGFMVWLAQAALMASYAVSFLTWDVLIRGGLLLLVTCLAGALAGAWVYSEPGDMD
jgi:hypothetical protein